MTGAEHAAERVEFGFDALSELYYRYWGEYFHLAIAEEEDDPKDLAACYERTQRRYFEAIVGQTVRPGQAAVVPIPVLHRSNGHAEGPGKQTHGLLRYPVPTAGPSACSP
jgi:hypothetical protein